MNYVSMQIHRDFLGRSTRARTLFYALYPFLRAGRCVRSPFYFNGAKESLGTSTKFPFGRLSFPFFNLGTNVVFWIVSKTIELGVFSGNENQSGRKFLCEFSTIFSPFFQIRAKLFWRLVRLNNPHSARGRWKWPSILQWSTSSKEPAGERQELRKKNQSPLSTKTRSFAPLFLDHRRAARKKSEALRLELNLCSSISTPKWSRIVAQLALNMSFASSTLSFL